MCLKVENSGLLWVDERCEHCLMSQGGERWTVVGGLKAHGEPGTCESVDIVVCLKMENSGLLWVDERCGHCLMSHCLTSQGGLLWEV